MQQPRKREGLLWTGLSTVLVLVIVLLTFSSTALAQSNERESQRLLGVFYEVFQFIQRNYVDEDKVDPKTLIEGALKGMFESLGDPHSAYLDAEEMRSLRDTTTGEFGGVGLYILKTDEGVEVARPIDGTPAAEAGVQGGDLIVAVAGQSTLDLTIEEVVDLLRGKPGTDVTMTIRRGSEHVADVTVTRAIIEIPTVRHAMIPGDIGYLQISQFTPNTGPQVREAIFDFQQKGYKGLVIDVRSNPGGLLSAVVDVCDLFFDRGTVIVTTHSRIPGESRTYEARTRAIVDQSLPIAVLIDRYSASAAEILTGAFKDLKRARIFGEKSFGKGSVQQVVPIETGGFRLTTSRYHTPSGASIDQVGITPDQVVQPREYTDEEIASIRKLADEGTITKFVEDNPNPSQARIAAFIDSLVKQGIMLREERIRKSIRDEVNRKKNDIQIYDLDYDTVLREAVGYLQSQ